MIYDDGSTVGRLHESERKSRSGHGFSIESGLLLAASLAELRD